MKLCEIFVFLVCCAGFCGALRCYTCESDSVSSCGESFNPNNVKQKDNCVGCGKVRVYKNSKMVIGRSCETNPSLSSSGCGSTEPLGVDGTACYCSTDLCNSVPSSTARFPFVVIPLVMFFICPYYIN